MIPFTHFHVHSQFSILDGATNIEKMLKKASEDNMSAVSLTDHGNMFGIKLFFDTAKKYDIKAILGVEAYVSRTSRHDKKIKEDRSGEHLIILAKNMTGYHNLVKLCSLSYIEGYYYKPRVDKEILEKYKEGLIISSACLGGEIPQKIMKSGIEDAEKSAMWYKNVFGEDYYLEIMRHPSGNAEMDKNIYDNQILCNEAIMDISKKLDIKVIATNDVHFLNKEDAEAHDLLICLNTGRDVDDPTRMRYTRQEWFKTQEEMNELFKDVPEALKNTQEIVDKIEFYELDHDPIMPDFPLPEGFTDEDDYLKHLTYEGAKPRYGNPIPADVLERIDFELATIKNMGFPGYFLIVQDFIQAGRDMGVVVGPGRGSAAGSAVAYCTGITSIDPIKYDLLFERFLNPDRISMPDIDIDFDDIGRQQVLDWVTDKYGKDKVAHIITFGTMAAKSALKDVARVLKLELSEANRLAKMIPDGPKMSLPKAYKENPDLEKEKESDNPLISKTIELAEILEGSVRQQGVHACGILIGRDPLIENLPVQPSKDDDLLTTQYDGRFVEPVGILKMDFLGLRTLSIIKDTIKNIKLSQGIDVDIDTVSLEDQKTFDLFSNGETTGIFQFESPGMKKHLKALKPNKFEDLVAMNALYRPGPMEYIPTFIKRKHGEEEIIYDHPLMEPHLNNTYGITVYQEQVMLQSRTLGGFSRGMSDSLRKAMGKKKIKEMDKLKVQFIDGCKSNEEFVKGYEEKVKGRDDKIKKIDDLIEKIWKDWEAFASYAFNKSHSVCYAYIAYQTGFLKAHYPAEFMAAVLSHNLSQIEKVSIFMDECKRMGLSVLTPDVNESYDQFMVNKKGEIRFAMAAIKGVGDAAVENIIKERTEKGPYIDVYDFFKRVNLRAVNKKTIENLVMAGGFDGFEFKRSQYFNAPDGITPILETLHKFGNKVQNESGSGILSLFGDMEEYKIENPIIPECAKWSDIETANKEKELIGMYLTSHPLDEYRLYIDSFCTSAKQLNENMAEFLNKDITVAGIITEAREGMTKKGNPFAIFKIEDFTDTYEIPLFGKDYIGFKNYINIGTSIFIKGKVQKKSWGDENQLDFKINTIDLLTEMKEQLIKNVNILVDSSKITDELTNELYSCFTQNPGNIHVNFLIFDGRSSTLPFISKKCRINISSELLQYFANNDAIQIKIS